MAAALAGALGIAGLLPQKSGVVAEHSNSGLSFLLGKKAMFGQRRDLLTKGAAGTANTRIVTGVDGQAAAGG